MIVCGPHLYISIKIHSSAFINFVAHVSCLQLQNEALQENARNIQECEKRIKQLTDELENRKQTVEVR